MLVVMSAFEVICTLAATLWICVVLVAAVVGYRFMAKLRARRRRIDRLLYVVRMPVRLANRDGWQRDQVFRSAIVLVQQLASERVQRRSH
jgi:hypothetical protein